MDDLSLAFAHSLYDHPLYDRVHFRIAYSNTVRDDLLSNVLLVNKDVNNDRMYTLILNARSKVL